MAFRGTADI